MATLADVENLQWYFYGVPEWLNGTSTQVEGGVVYTASLRVYITNSTFGLITIASTFEGYPVYDGIFAYAIDGRYWPYIAETGCPDPVQQAVCPFLILEPNLDPQDTYRLRTGLYDPITNMLLCENNWNRLWFVCEPGDPGGCLVPQYGS